MKTAKKIALIAFLWILVVSSGTVGTLDTSLRLQMAHAWWTGTPEIVDLDYKPIIRGDIRSGIMGVDGKRYIAYEQGQSILMLPGDWVGTQVHRLFPALSLKDARQLVVSLLIFVPLNVAAVLAGYWLLRLFEFDRRTAGLTSLLSLLGTTMLHYAQVHQHNNQVLLLVTLGYAAAIAYLQQGKTQFALLSGFVLGGAMLVRITSTIHALTVFLFFVGCLAYQYRDKLQRVVKGALCWIVGFIPLTLVGRTFDFLRYGSFLASGKSVEQQQLATDPTWTGLPELPANFPLINAPHVGIVGALSSPAKSIFIYDPLLLPCLVLAIVLWKTFSPVMRWYLVTAALNLALHLVAYGRFLYWHGDTAWGARYQVTSVHLLLFPLLAVLVQRYWLSRGVKAWLASGLITLALMVQLASVAMPMHLEVAQAEIGAPGSRRQFRLGQRLANVACLVTGSPWSFCVDRLDPEKRQYLGANNHINFLPFTFSKRAADNPALSGLSIALFIVWGLAVLLASGATLIYLRYLFQAAGSPTS